MDLIFFEHLLFSGHYIKCFILMIIFNKDLRISIHFLQRRKQT